MTYAVLLRPHANVRYFQSVSALAEAELSLMLPLIDGAENLRRETLGGLDLLCFDAPSLSAEAESLLRRHSALYALFALENGALRPLMEGPGLEMGSDISGILKYKGKTNEQFTGFLINLAVLSGSFANKFGENLKVLDPLCGRGTTLFEALRRNYHAAGVELDITDIGELTRFFEKYLQHERYKHNITRGAMTVKGKAAGQRTVFSFARDAAQLKTDPLTLTVVQGDTRDTSSFYKTETFHALVADLPYGIQHSSLDGKNKAQLTQVMKVALRRYFAVLRPGAAIALSFNAYGISLQAVRELAAEAGFTPLTGGVYDTLEHWVEQAVMRDVVVAVKPAHTSAN